MGMSIFTNIGPMLIYLAAGYLMLKRGDSGLTVGDVTVIVTLLGRLYRPVNSLLDIQVDVIKSMALFTRIFDYFDMPVEIKNAEHAIVPERVTGNLRFDRVRFYYDEQKEVLQMFRFRCRPAERWPSSARPDRGNRRSQTW